MSTEKDIAMVKEDIEKIKKDIAMVKEDIKKIKKEHIEKVDKRQKAKDAALFTDAISALKKKDKEAFVNACENASIKRPQAEILWNRLKDVGEEIGAGWL
jgi:hypothetical protein